MFEEIVSLYAHAKDRIGIGSVSLGEFFLDGAYAQEVGELRDMVKRLGSAEAKKNERYHEIKSKLPAVTVSGLFSRRKGECLLRHSGFICLDIDLADNQHLCDFDRQVMFVLRHRPEVALAMHSCSGTGYFALVPLAHPEEHKRHFRALQYQYKQQGIIIDKACSDITRLRFASYDEHPYINGKALPFEDMDAPEQRVIPKYKVKKDYEYQDPRMKIERLVSEIVRRGIDLTPTYDEWMKIGYSLKEFGQEGYQWFQRLSAMNPKYRPSDTEEKWRSLGQSTDITVAYFFARCRDKGLSLK